MSWSTIESAEVMQEFTVAEKASLNAVQGTTTSIDSILERTVNAVRGDILAGGNELGDEDTIPDQLREDVIAIARWRWLVSIPQLKAMQTEERRDLYTRAADKMEKIAAGQLRVEPPGGESPTPSPRITSRDRQFERARENDDGTTQAETMDGI